MSDAPDTEAFDGERGELGPLLVLGPLPHFGSSAHAALLSPRAHTDDELPERMLVHIASGGHSEMLLAEAALRVRLKHKSLPRLIRRGTSAGFAWAAYQPEVAAPLIMATTPFAPPEALAMADEIADAHGLLADGVELTATIAPHEVCVRDDGTALVLSPPARGRGAHRNVPAWSLASEARTPAFIGRPRPDVWTVGVLLYWALTGTHPFAGDDPATLTEHTLVPLRDRASDVPSELNAVVMRALAWRPDDRHADLVELRRDLARLMEQWPTPTREERAQAAQARLEQPLRATANAWRRARR